ncbi:MAG: hypothetical protein ACTSUE_11460 [Promethearchaeota archaeon]
MDEEKSGETWMIMGEYSFVGSSTPWGMRIPSWIVLNIVVWFFLSFGIYRFMKHALKREEKMMRVRLNFESVIHNEKLEKFLLKYENNQRRRGGSGVKKPLKG